MTISSPGVPQPESQWWRVALIEAVAGSLHVVYVVAGLVAVVSLLLALALPARLSPTRPLTQRP
jgi:hypothetical protein